MTLDWEKYRIPDQSPAQASSNTSIDWEKYRIPEKPKFDFQQAVKETHPIREQREQEAQGFDRQAALEKGYTPEQIEKYIQTESLTKPESAARAGLKGTVAGLDYPLKAIRNLQEFLAKSTGEEVPPDRLKQIEEYLEKELPDKDETFEHYTRRVAAALPTVLATQGASLPAFVQSLVAGGGGQIAEEAGAGPGGQAFASALFGLGPDVLRTGLRGIGKNPNAAASVGPSIKDLGKFKTSGARAGNQPQPTPQPISQAPSALIQPGTQVPGKSAAQTRTGPTAPIGNIVTRQPTKSEYEIGHKTSEETKKLAEQEALPHRKEYEKSRQITSKFVAPSPKLAHEAQQMIDELEKTPKRNPGQQVVYDYAKTLKDLLEAPGGGYIAVPFDRLVALADTMAAVNNYEMPYVGYKGKLKKLVKDINKEVIASLDHAGIDSGPVKNADRLYAKWADRFLGDEISPFLERKILNPESLARKINSDEGTYRAVKNALGDADKSLLESIDRSLIEQKLSKYEDDLSKVGTREYEKEIRDLKHLVGDKITARADKKLRNQAVRHAKSPEQSEKSFKSVEGIRNLKGKLSKEEFEKLRQEKIHEIFRQGKYGGKTLTGNDIVDTIDKHHVILDELMGKDVVAALYKEAISEGKQEFTSAIIEGVIRALVKTGLKYAGLAPILKPVIQATKSMD